MLKTLDIVCASLAIFFKQIKSANSRPTDLFGKLDFICELFKNQDNDKFAFFIFSLCCFVLGSHSVACVELPSGYTLHMHFVSRKIVETLILFEGCM